MALTYDCQVDINLPRERVIELFDNPDNLKEWQPGLISFEHLSGEPGHPGARSRLVYQMGKRRIEMIETITERNLPERFSGTYETKGAYNEMVNEFSELGPDRTRWVSHVRFELSGLMKIMGWLMPSTFRKQSQSFMVMFREFAEKEGKR